MAADRRMGQVVAVAAAVAIAPGILPGRVLPLQLAGHGPLAGARGASLPPFNIERSMA
ncbi:hypothetical protein [Novosphingobium terrae]|uniref:hypothetical protein n=1 Tax=Novosphingobium terrae TaxID=2726189 RepID=UPI00197ED1FC|nr:hypothetical protein [Novosphingobium terrae]